MDPGSHRTEQRPATASRDKGGPEKSVGPGTTEPERAIVPPPQDFRSLVGSAMPGDPPPTSPGFSQRLRAMLPWQTTTSDDPVTV